MGTFFIQTPLNFEKIAQLELDLKFPELATKFSIVDGGLEGIIEINQGFELNYFLKIPNKILLRLDSFKCRDLPKLYNKVKKKDFKFFNYGQEFNFNTSAVNSRLFDERKINNNNVQI